MIRSIKAAQRLDSRGTPTVQVDLTTDKGTFRASVPSGASTGANEAVEIRDGGLTYHGKGVITAVHNVEQVIAPALVKSNLSVATDQKQIDTLLNGLDGTQNKSNLGSNATLGVSMACARAGSAHLVMPHCSSSAAGCSTDNIRTSHCTNSSVENPEPKRPISCLCRSLTCLMVACTRVIRWHSRRP